MSGLELYALPNTLAVCKLLPSEAIPKWAVQSSFFNITKTNEELSIVCDDSDVPRDTKAERGWRCLRVKGSLDFGLTGVLSSLVNPLAEARISIFSISTYNTDYLLVKEISFAKAISILSAAGHKIEEVQHA